MLDTILLLLLITSSSARLCSPDIQTTVRDGYKLVGHVVTTYSFLGDREVCIEACASAQSCCKSINFYRTKKECQLNKGNHESNPENMTEAIDSEYIDYPMGPCNIALGMKDKRISDHQITASSAEFGELGTEIEFFHGYLARLSSPKTDKISFWMARNNDLRPWLQVDFLHQVYVCAIATQGSIVGYWVKTYSLQYSDDGVVFADYKKGHILEGNTDANNIVNNDLIPAIVARYIRVLPKSWNYRTGMKIELYG